MWISLEPFINSFRVNRLGLQPIRMGEQGWNLLNTNKVHDNFILTLLFVCVFDLLF
jgi:hypothetical protein